MTSPWLKKGAWILMIGLLGGCGPKEDAEAGKTVLKGEELQKSGGAPRIHRLQSGAAKAAPHPGY